MNIVTQTCTNKSTNCLQLAKYEIYNDINNMCEHNNS